MVEATVREGIGPRQMARLAGLFLFLTTGFGLYAQVGVVGSLIDLRDASTTSANIVAHAPFYLAGFSLYMVEMLCQMAMMTCLYLLLRPAGRNVALVALILVFGVDQRTVEAAYIGTSLTVALFIFSSTLSGLSEEKSV